MAINFIPKIIYDPGSGPITLSFTYPPEGDPFSESIKTTGAEAISKSGKEQFNKYFDSKIIKMKFRLLTKTQLDSLRTFFIDHASFGREFDYYPSESEAAFETFRLNKKSFEPKRTSPDGANDFNYSLELEFRRVF